MDALLNLLAAALMFVAVYFLWRTPGSPAVQHHLHRAALALLGAALCQIAVASYRLGWG